MISKRMAITALFTGTIGRMAHSEPPQVTSGNGPAPTAVANTTTLATILAPHSWTVQLDNVTEIRVTFRGETLTFTPEEIMKALRR